MFARTPVGFPLYSARASPRRAFFLAHFGLGLEVLMDNFLCVLAVRADPFPLVEEEARPGRPGALRVLALWPDLAERTVPTLSRSSAVGRGRREMAEKTLRRVGGTGRHRRPGDPGTARGPGDGPGRRRRGGSLLGRVGWNIGGYHVRLIGGERRGAAGGLFREKVAGSVPPAVRRDPQFEEVQHAERNCPGAIGTARAPGTHHGWKRGAYRGERIRAALGSPAARGADRRSRRLQVEGEEFLWRPRGPDSHDGNPPALAEAAGSEIVHPVLLHQAGTLEAWQERMVRTNLAQPFKQLFREIYVVGEGERDAAGPARGSPAGP